MNAQALADSGGGPNGVFLPVVYPPRPTGPHSGPWVGGAKAQRKQEQCVPVRGPKALACKMERSDTLDGNGGPNG